MKFQFQHKGDNKVLSVEDDINCIGPEGDPKIGRIDGSAQDRAYVTLDLTQEELQLGHLSTKLQVELRKLEKNYTSAFASANRKIGDFKGFIASIQLTDYSPHRDIKRSFSSQVISEIKPTILELLREEIIEALFVSNILAVAKPNSLNILHSKFDKFVLKNSGVNLNRSRLCVDIRNLNKRISPPPPVNLPKLAEIKVSLHNHLLSTLDISAMFYTVSGVLFPIRRHYIRISSIDKGTR